MKENKYYIFSDTAKLILAAIRDNKKNVSISTDLNKSSGILTIKENRIYFDNNNTLSENELSSITKKQNRVFILEENKLRILEYRNDNYYKLVPTNGAPTVEINGIKMHRSKNIDPFEDARLKASQVVKKDNRVLDTCGGLGYTAIWSVMLGAKIVVSTERSEYIQKLRKENPWSEELFQKKIQLISTDISKYITEFESESFDSIIHDPPRFSFAGNLYGEEFYKELYRVLVKNGNLFHYTGSPYIVRRGNSFSANAGERLKKAGFKNVIQKHEILGVIARK